MPEETYFYREGTRQDLEKAPDIIGISFLRAVPPPATCAFPDEPEEGSTNLRRVALRPPEFGVYRLDVCWPAGPGDLRARRDSTMSALRAIDRTTFVSHAYRTDPRAETNVLVLTDEIVAEIPGVPPARLREILRARGLRHVRTIDTLRRIVLLQVTARAGMNALKVANRLVEDGIAAAAEPNFVRRLPFRGGRRSADKAVGKTDKGRRSAGRDRATGDRPKASRPGDPLFARQWHLDNPGKKGARRGADVRALQAWTRTTGSRSVTIAIVDDGLDLKHEDFRARGKVVAGYNFQDRNDDPSALPTNRHGTACAGIAAALSDNGKGGCGIAPRCRLMPVRTPDEWGEEVGYADALAWAADNGADVISCSWGPPDGYWSDDPLPLAMSAALDRATRTGRGGRGSVITWAAGNGNEPVDLDGFASDPRVIAVAASDDRDLKASYSDFGKAISVCAPSGDTFTGRGGIWTTDLSGASGYSRGNYTGEFGGTSAAAPLAAGVAALVLSANENLTWAQVREVLQDTAEKIDPQGTFMDAKGGGHSAQYEAGRSLCYGHGRLNAARAVERASELRGQTQPTRLHSAGEPPHPPARAAPRATPAEAEAYYHRGGKRIGLRRVPAEQLAADRVRGSKAAAHRGGHPKAENRLGEAYLPVGGDPQSVLLPSGEIVVQFAPGLPRERIERELSRRQARVVRRLPYLPNGFLVDARESRGGALALANELHEQPFVVAAEPNWIRRTARRGGARGRQT